MRFSVDPPELRTAAAQFASNAEAYQNVYNSLLNTANTMGEAWRAEDNMTYVNQINGLCQKLMAMVQHLNQASQGLIQQATNYENTRDHNKTSVTALPN